MFLYILLFSAFAWSVSKCEPPVNSYLPPSTGNAGNPSSQYGPPELRGNGRSGNSMNAGNQRQNQPPDSYSIPGRSDPSRPLDTQYGPPSSGRGSGQGSTRPSQFGSPSQSDPSKLYGAPSGPRGQGNGPLEQVNQLPSPFDGANERPQSTYNSPRGPGVGNSGPSGRGNGFGPSGSRFGQRPDSSYGPPPSGDVRPGNGGQFSQNSHDEQGSFSAPRRDSGVNSFNENPPLDGPPASSYGTPGFGGSPGSRGSDDGGSSFGGESGEPAKYEFSYDVDDAQSGTKFGHSEQRDDDTATGQYHVELPDGRKQVVEYEAGLQGYKPQIRYEGGRNGAAGALGNGNNDIQGGSRGYPREGPGGSSNDIGYPDSTQGGSPGKYQQAGNQDGPESNGQGFMGYPSGRPGGTTTSGGSGQSKGLSNFPSGNGDSMLENFNGGVRGGRPFSDADNRGNAGYSRGGPQGSTDNRSEGYPRGGPQGSTSNRGIEDYPRGGPQGGAGNRGSEGYSRDGPQGSAGNRGSEGYPRGGPQGGAGNRGSEGYPRGGPQGDANNRGSEGYPRGGPQGGAGNRDSEGYSSGGPQGGTGNRGSEGYPRVGSQGGNGDFSQGNDRKLSNDGAQGPYRGQSSRGMPGNNRNGGDEGYPRGGPSGPRGSGY